jgi:hypothetical protein
MVVLFIYLPQIRKHLLLLHTTVINHPYNSNRQRSKATSSTDLHHLLIRKGITAIRWHHETIDMHLTTEMFRHLQVVIYLLPTMHPLHLDTMLLLQTTVAEALVAVVVGQVEEV